MVGLKFIKCGEIWVVAVICTCMDVNMYVIAVHPN